MVELNGKRPWNVFTLGNFMTALRLVFGAVSIWLYFHQMFFMAALSFGIAAITDFFDGKVARWREKKNGNGISRFGEIFDPICDRLLIIPGMVIQPFLLVLIAIEGLATACALYVRKQKGHHFISKWSKVATFVQFPFITLLFLSRSPVEIWTCTVIICFSSAMRFSSYFWEIRKMEQMKLLKDVSKAA